MKIVIPGGAGQVGTVPAGAFAPGDEVVVLSRGGTPVRVAAARHPHWAEAAKDLCDRRRHRGAAAAGKTGREAR